MTANEATAVFTIETLQAILDSGSCPVIIDSADGHTYELSSINDESSQMYDLVRKVDFRFSTPEMLRRLNDGRQSLRQ